MWAYWGDVFIFYLYSIFHRIMFSCLVDQWCFGGVLKINLNFKPLHSKFVTHEWTCSQLQEPQFCHVLGVGMEPLVYSTQDRDLLHVCGESNLQWSASTYPLPTINLHRKTGSDSKLDSKHVGRSFESWTMAGFSTTWKSLSLSFGYSCSCQITNFFAKGILKRNAW